MIVYTNTVGEKVAVPDQYTIDIVPEIMGLTKDVLPRFAYGLLKGAIQYPTGVMVQMSETYEGYASGQSWQKKMVFSFQVRTTSSQETTNLCSQIKSRLAPLYDMRVRARRDFTQQEICIQDFSLGFVVHYNKSKE